MAFKLVRSGPDSAQHPTSTPSIATAGTECTPRIVAFAATSGSFMSRTTTSHEGAALLDERPVAIAIAGDDRADAPQPVGALRYVAVERCADL